jgi:glutathione S-transferase
MACAIARGLAERITKVPCNPHASPPELLAVNPTSKVPCLVTDDGFALFDSPVICEYLDSRGDELPLFPEHGALRWRSLKFQAMGDGILDAAVPCRGELARPQEDARDAAIARFKAAISRTVAALEADPPHKLVDIGSIAVACALGYLDFRFPSDHWRDGHPKLAAWYEAFAGNPCIADTAPRE